MRLLFAMLCMWIVLWVGATPSTAEVLCANWNTREFFEHANSAKIIRCLIKNQNRQHKDRKTPLHYAAAFSVSHVVKVLLKTGAKPNTRDNKGLTPLHWAALLSKNPYVVKTLLNAGADLAARDKAGKTPSNYGKMNVALKETKLYQQLNRVSCANWNTKEFFERAGVKDISRCLKSGSKVSTVNKSGWTPLHIAAGWNKKPAVVSFLIKAGANLNAKDEFGLTPLHWATAFSKNPTVVTALLDAGANPLMGNLAGEIPWDYVNTNTALKGAKLHKQLAQISCSTWNKKTFFEVASAADISRCLKTNKPNARDEKGWTPLHWAAMESKISTVVTTLLEAGAKVNARTEDGWTALHVAAAFSKTPKIVKTLLAAGTKLNALDEKRRTPLHVAAAFSKTPTVVTILLKAGVKVNARDAGGWTSLHWAALQSTNPSVVTTLIQAGSNPNAQNKFKMTPLHLAALKNKSPAIVTALMDAGANPTEKDNKGKTPWDYAKQNPALKGTDVYWRLNEGRFK